jgi:hypothetical protein
MTEAEYKALHIELWQWLYDHPDKGKEDWPGWEKYCDKTGHIHNLCFACVFAGYCVPYCPLNQELMQGCRYDQGAYASWCDSYGKPDEHRKYAALIRDAWRKVP